MKKILLATVAVLALTGVASASEVLVGEGAAGSVVTLASGGGSAAVSGASVGNFNITLSGASAPILSLPDILNGNTIDAVLAGGGPQSVTIWVSSTGNTGPLGTQDLLSSFTQNDLTAGWTVTALTYADNTDTAYGTQQLLATTVFNSSDPPDVSVITTAMLGAGTYSVTDQWIISASGAGDTNNTTDITVATTPLPAAAWMFAGGLGILGFMGRRKRRSTASTFTAVAA